MSNVLNNINSSSRYGYDFVAGYSYDGNVSTGDLTITIAPPTEYVFGRDIISHIIVATNTHPTPSENPASWGEDHESDETIVAINQDLSPNIQQSATNLRYVFAEIKPVAGSDDLAARTSIHHLIGNPQSPQVGLGTKYPLITAGADTTLRGSAHVIVLRKKNSGVAGLTEAESGVLNSVSEREDIFNSTNIAERIRPFTATARLVALSEDDPFSHYKYSNPTTAYPYYIAIATAISTSEITSFTWGFSDKDTIEYKSFLVNGHYTVIKYAFTDDINYFHSSMKKNMVLNNGASLIASMYACGLGVNS